MANHLPFEKQVSAIKDLVEGSSLRSIERKTGIHHDTIGRLAVRVGTGCARILDETMRDLNCRQIQVDEIWGFVGKKARNVMPHEQDGELGDVWTYVALDPESKAVPSFLVGKRDQEHTQRFTHDLASRMRGRIQLSSDGMNQYLETVDDAFGSDVDYGQVIKVYASNAEGVETSRRYSPPPIVSVKKKVICGQPDEDFISTSMVERQNLTLRMHCRRLTRLTNAFSKKLDNFKAAISLHYGFYNLVKIHSSIRCTPAMAVGATSRLWTMEELVERALN